jgi:hypothetical protein
VQVWGAAGVFDISREQRLGWEARWVRREAGVEERVCRDMTESAVGALGCRVRTCGVVGCERAARWARGGLLDEVRAEDDIPVGWGHRIKIRFWHS